MTRRGALLLACALTDRLRDGLSMVYSFFHPGAEALSLRQLYDSGSCARRAAGGTALCLSWLWVRGSDKMDYRSALALEALTPNGWETLKLD